MSRLRAVPPGAWLAVLVAASTGLRFLAASRVPSPWIAPDEFIYAALGRSLWSSGHFTILGEPTRFYSLVYPLLNGLPLSLSDRELGYRLLQLLQALAMSLAAVPVYYWTRSLAGWRSALLAATMTLAVPGLAYAGLVMSEVAFYPVFVLAAWAMARALARPTLARQALALGGVLLCAATRLQAIVLVPALVTALGLQLLLDRSPRRARAFWPTGLALAVAVGGWFAWQLRNGAPVTEVLAAYRAAGEADYSVGDALRYAVWHLADVALLVGVFPLLAVAVMVVRALARGEASPEVRAYLATAASLVVWTAAEVGAFASRSIGHLGERQMLGLAPLLFVGFGLWLARGSPRPRAATIAVAASLVVLVLYLPLASLATLAGAPSTFTLIPLWRLRLHSPSFDGELLVDVLVAVAAAAFVLVPRRATWALAAASVVALAAISLSVGRVVAGQAALVRLGEVGDRNRWVDDAADGPAAYLYTADVIWPSTYAVPFWNRRLDRVYTLGAVSIDGPLPRTPVNYGRDGRLFVNDRHPYVVASNALTLVGERVASSGPPALSMWRIDPPLRLDSWTQGVRPGGLFDGRARVELYACRGARLRLELTAPEARRVTIKRDERLWRRLDLAAGETWRGSVPSRGPGGLCSWNVDADGPLVASVVEPARAP